jgi:ubiquinone/menaquinone biosynthesis C-methylase UbiE
VNPNWPYQDQRGVAENEKRWDGDGRSVSAVAGALPFRDDSFDLVVSLWGVPVYLPGTVSEYKQAFTEINRVMKPRSVGIFYPVSWHVATEERFYTEVLLEAVDNYILMYKGKYPKLLVFKGMP